MNPKLVFLHIPKSAGTTYREYLIKVYGEQSVFWYGMHSQLREFDAKEVASASVVGGHRQLDFFPRDFDALYASIVRDPIERAVSFFNYCTAPYESKSTEWSEELSRTQEIWRERGVTASSLVKSIENSEHFRWEINNFQCAYLSRYGASYQGVRRTLEEVDMVIGVFDQLPRFNQFLKSELKFQRENNIRTNFSNDGYMAPILAEPGAVELIRSLNTEDQALYDFVSSECGGLYLGATRFAELIERVPDIFSGTNLQRFAGQFDWRSVHLFSKGFVGITPDKESKILLTLNNGSPSGVALGETADRVCAIGWELLNDDYKGIEGASGICKRKVFFAPGESKVFDIEIVIDRATWVNENPRSIEFFVVDSDDQVREKYPLNSAWGSLYAV
jgi:Sulfotransferase family